MKKIILLLLIFVSFSKIGKTQTSDVLTHLQSIVANKAQYVGHDFSNLLNSLQFPIKYFQPKRGIAYEKVKETSTRFGFNFAQNASEVYLTYPSLEIYWQTALNAVQSDVLWENHDGGGWSTTVANFYNNSIITDIKLRQ